LAPIPTEQLYHPVRICEECFQKLYPEEVAKKALAATEIETAKSEAIEIQSYPELNINNHSTHEQNGIILTTSDQRILPNMSDGNSLINKKEAVNESFQKECNSLPLSDIKSVVTSTATTNVDNQHQILEGEACVILNSSN
jgi:hypothetical protein